MYILLHLKNNFVKSSIYQLISEFECFIEKNMDLCRKNEVTEKSMKKHQMKKLCVG